MVEPAHRMVLMRRHPRNKQSQESPRRLKHRELHKQKKIEVNAYMQGVNQRCRSVMADFFFKQSIQLTKNGAVSEHFGTPSFKNDELNEEIKKIDIEDEILGPALDQQMASQVVRQRVGGVVKQRCHSQKNFTLNDSKDEFLKNRALVM